MVFFSICLLGAPVKKKKKVEDEAFEESDDGDEEGRERDYISDSSDRYYTGVRSFKSDAL